MINVNLKSLVPRGRSTKQLYETKQTIFKSNQKSEPKTKVTGSLDRHFVQLRQRQTENPNYEQDLKNLLKSKGILYGDSLEATKLYFADEWDQTLESYIKWREAMERCYLILKNKRPSDMQNDNFIRQAARDKKGIVAQCQTRFSPKEKKITRWRMNCFSEKVMSGGFRYGLEITLTTDPKRFRDLKDVGDNWKFYLEKFMNFCYTRFTRAGKKGLYVYLRAAELTESGLLHMHIGFFGPGITGKQKKTYADGREIYDYILPQKDISKLWEKYGIAKVTWIKKKPVNDVTDYITKHVAKTWGRYDANQMLEAFLHKTNMRQWSASLGAVPKEPPALERFEMVNVAFNPGEALLWRQDLIDDGYELIQDDLKDSVGYPI